MTEIPKLTEADLKVIDRPFASDPIQLGYSGPTVLVDSLFSLKLYCGNQGRMMDIIGHNAMSLKRGAAGGKLISASRVVSLNENYQKHTFDMKSRVMPANIYLGRWYRLVPVDLGLHSGDISVTVHAPEPALVEVLEGNVLDRLADEADDILLARLIV